MPPAVVVAKTKTVKFETMSVSSDNLNIRLTQLPPPFTAGRYFTGAAVVQNEADDPIGIIQVGGKHITTAETVSVVEFLEWNLLQWWTLPSLTEARSGCAVATIKNTVYVIGGADAGSSPLATVEFYTFGSPRSWQPIRQPMLQRRWFCGAVGMDRRSMMVVAGGRDESWQPLKTVEAYDFHNRKWTQLAPMSTARFGSAVVALGHRIMVIGGHDGKKALTTCQAYNLREGEGWYDMPFMPIALAFCSATVVQRDSRYIFVWGQTNDPTRTGDGATTTQSTTAAATTTANNIIQCYCERSQKWTVLKTSEFLEAGPILSFDDDLVFLGGPRKEPGGGRVGGKAMCRRWDLSNINLANYGDDRTLGDRTQDEDLYSTSRSRYQPQQQQQQQQPRRVSNDGPFVETVGDHDSVDRSRATISTARTPVAIPIAEAQRSVVTEPEPAPNGSVGGNHHHPRQIMPVTDHQIEEGHGEFSVYTGDLCAQTRKPHGHGRMRTDYSGEVYYGNWRDGKKHGLGLTTFASTGESHEGLYENGRKHGAGTYRWRDGRVYMGNFVNDHIEDTKGTLTWKDSRKYVGNFVQGDRTGHGRLEFPNGDVYTGQFVSGRYEGFGTLVFSDGKIYEGNWRGNQANGEGVLLGVDGETLHEGWWENDRPARQT